MWPHELGPRYAALQEELEDLAAGCDEYAEAVEQHREQLLIIGTQLAAMAFTMLFGYLYPAARIVAERAFKWLVARARLERTIFQKITKAILEQRAGKRRVGTYVVREGLDALADSVLWAGLKTGVHAASSAATGQPMGNLWEYAGRHFVAEMAYNGGIKGLSDARRFFPRRGSPRRCSAPGPPAGSSAAPCRRPPSTPWSPAGACPTKAPCARRWPTRPGRSCSNADTSRSPHDDTAAYRRPRARPRPGRAGRRRRPPGGGEPPAAGDDRARGERRRPGRRRAVGHGLAGRAAPRPRALRLGSQALAEAITEAFGRAEEDLASRSHDLARTAFET
ncbi:hypothetical protein ACFQ0B_59435 [Nonomuraea thailandensis]